MSEIPKEACGHCGGTGGVDSGGSTPWGAPITLPCPACEIIALRAREIELAKTLILSAEKSSQLESENNSLRARVRELESGGVTTSDFLTPIERQRDQLEIENRRLKARVRDLEVERQ